MDTLAAIHHATGEKFFFIIDEWDAICREFPGRQMMKGDPETVTPTILDEYVMLLRRLFKTQDSDKVFAGAYLTGILPIKRYNAAMEELKRWYDGYTIGREKSIYNPYSVIKALQRGVCKSYWTTRGAYDSVLTYIQMNYDGLKDDIIRMLSGEHVYVDTTEFRNDMRVVRSKNDVLTVLIHLGYLAYDEKEQECYLPNKEVADEMNNAI